MTNDEIQVALLKPTTTVEVAGQALGLSRGAAYKAARTGDLPTIRIGRSIKVPTAHLSRMLGLDRPQIAPDHQKAA